MLDPNEKVAIEEFVTRALRDISRPNPFSIKAGIRILMTTNLSTFEKVSSETVQNELKDFKKVLQNPETLAPKSTQTSEGQQAVIQHIKNYTLANLVLLDKRTAILPNTYTIQKSIMEGEHLKSVIHSSALRNVVTSAHYVDLLHKKFKEEGLPPKDIETQVKRAIESTHALHKAVLEGNISQVLQCLSVHGVDVNFPNEQGMTPLHLATREGLSETVKVLLTVPGIDVNKVSNNGWTPLHLAARMGYADIADALLTMPDIHVNAVNSEGWTPLHWAAWHGFTEVLTVLLTAPGIEINRIDKTGTTALHWAARNGHPDVISILLSLPQIQVNPADNEKRTALHFAVAYNHLDATRILLTSPDIEVNVADMDGLTPLHWAARNGQLEILKALLANRDTRIEEFDNNWMTPLDWAIRNGNLEAAKVLNPNFAKLKKKSFWRFLKGLFKRTVSEP